MLSKYRLVLVLCSAIVVVHIMFLYTNKLQSYSYKQNSKRWYPIWSELTKSRFTGIQLGSADYTMAEMTDNLSATETVTLQPNGSLSFNGQAVMSHQKMTERNQSNHFEYDGINLMTLTPYKFDPTYKNPCWKVQGTLQCLPYFFIIGVKKCGTSELWQQILLNPDVIKTGFGKEAQWFARKRFRTGHGDFQNYIDMFQLAANTIEYTFVEDPSTGQRFHPLIIGDASPSNLHLNSHWRYLPGNEQLDEPRYVILDYIQHFLPKAKIIIMFRNPVERLYSDYYHEAGLIRLQNASPEHFHEVVVNGLHLYERCFQTRTLRSCVYDERIYEELGIHIQLGIYHVYWKELLRLFPRDQLLIVHIKELKGEINLRKKVFDFLDLIYESKNEVPSSNSANMTRDKQKNHRGLQYVLKGDMLNETRRLLEEFYKPHNEEMYRLTQDSTFLYDSKFVK